MYKFLYGILYVMNTLNLFHLFIWIFIWFIDINNDLKKYLLFPISFFLIYFLLQNKTGKFSWLHIIAQFAILLSFRLLLTVLNYTLHSIHDIGVGG